MCRFVLYHGTPITLASLVTEPAHSIIRQSVHADETDEPLNGDGFGVAWYVPDLSDAPGVFRSVSPAWSNQNLLDLARVTKSRCVLAHVRAATSGLVVSESNCHPFTSGPFAFMHNGDIARFGQVKRRILSDLSDLAFSAIKGSTDSEHLFAVFLDEIRETNHAAAPDRANVMARALERAIHRIVAIVNQAKDHLPRPPGVAEGEDHCYINCAVSDGSCAVACRFTTDTDEPSSLYVHTGRRYICEDGLCRMVAPEKGHGAVIVASEKLSSDPGWQKVPRDHLVIIRETHEAELRPIAF
jgi:predicted glutamine amidotransferase